MTSSTPPAPDVSDASDVSGVPGAAATASEAAGTSTATTASTAAAAPAGRAADGDAGAVPASVPVTGPSRNTRRPPWRTWLLAVPVPVLLVLLWDRGVAGAWTLPLGIQMGFLPDPVQVARRLADLAFGGLIEDSYSRTLWIHLYASSLRVFQGFLLAVVLAVPLGIVMGRSSVLFRMLEPTINVVRPVPVTAWAPLALLIIGFGDRSTIFLVFLAAFFPVLLNTITGVRQVPQRLLEAAAMLGTPAVQALYKVVLPAAVPSIVSGLRIALGLAWVILVVGETVGINVGLGAMITQARDQSRTDLIICGMAVIGLAGFLADRLLVLLVRLLAGRRPLINT